MRRLLILPLLLAPLTGCIGAGMTAHRTTQLDGYFDSYNEANAALLRTPHEGVQTLTGAEYTLWLLPGIIGLGQAQMEGTSEATFTNGGTHRATVAANERIIHAGFPLVGGVEALERRMAVLGHLDAHWRTTAVTLQQTNGGATAGQTQTLRFEGDVMGLRPGVSAQAYLAYTPNLRVLARAYAGYDVPVFTNEPLASNYVNYLTNEYRGSSLTNDENKAVKADLRGVTGTVGIVVMFGCGACF